MDQPLQRNTLLYLANYVPLSGLMMMSTANKDIRDSLGSREVLSILKHKYEEPNATSLTQLYTQHNKVRDLVDAIKADDVELVLFILSKRSVDEDQLQTNLIPYVLSLAAVYNSENVFVAVCPMIIPEIDNVSEVLDMTNELHTYLTNVTTDVLRTNNAAMYEAFFSALSEANDGYTIGLFNEAVGDPDYVDLEMYYAYAHVLMGESESAYKVLRKYIDVEPSDSLIDGYEHTRSFDFLVWLVDSGVHTSEELKSVARYPHDEYLYGELTYDEVKEIEKADLQGWVDSITVAIEELGEL